MKQIEQLHRAIQNAKNLKRANRQLSAATEAIELGNLVEGIEQTVIDLVRRLDEDRAKRQTFVVNGSGRLSTREVSERLGICKTSVSMLVSGGHLTPSNPDAPNGAPHYFDQAHIINFLKLNSSGAITRMISDYRHRERTPRRRPPPDSDH